MSNVKEELARLERTLNQVDDLADTLEQTPRYRGEDFTQQVLEDRRELQREVLKSATVEPYFGRLDFKEWEQNNGKALYIGKVGVHDEVTGDPLIVDWRAPVSSLFYSFSGSEDDVYYVSPEGVVEGEIQLKRNIVIRSRTLQRVVDSYVEGQEASGGDEFLLYKLGEQKDNKLKDIVSTIQAEQNAIIRHPLKEPLIIQGAAGSGKTTVALHRLAFLLYEYREQLKAERMIIFAPNAMFLDYISHVLPELGVGGITQRTFVDWAIAEVGQGITAQPLVERMENQFERSIPAQVEKEQKQKGSLAFKAKLEQYMTESIAKSIPTNDFLAWDGKVLGNQTIQTWIEKDFAASPPLKKRERLLARMKRWIEIEVKWFDDLKEQKSMKSEALKRLRAYMSTWAMPNYIKLYTAFLKQEGMSVSAGLGKKQLAYEDIAPVLFIHQRMRGIEKEDRFDHIVIDEAQDSSPFMITVLKERTRQGGFTILGDLAQGIHGNEGISTWLAIQEAFSTKEIAYVQMERSYRSTMEIIQFSNTILAQLENGPSLAKPVFRSGKEVVVELQEKEHLKNWIARNNEAETAAILTRTKAESAEVYEQLSKAGVKLTHLQASDQTYRGGLSVMPIYLAKGFEFDSVLLLYVDEQNYPNDELHKKLLYVGCTRALHDLTLWYTKKPSPLLVN
ncbi:UvrD/Rep helicase family protein [Bacillus sp. JCM 19046]|nr:UvrD/Rep helicase family protein [Bacillus sp. JCM 19046]